MLNKQNRALFILHEGIGATIFNSQVTEHSRGMKELNIKFDILAYNVFEKTWVLSNRNLSLFKNTDPDIKIILKRAMNIYYPFSSLYNLIILVVFLIRVKREYSFIQARADYTAFLCILAKPFHRLPVYWDCRGDAVSELKDSLSRKSLIMKIIGNLFLVSFNRFTAYINCKYCDGAIFVSQALFKLFQNGLKTENYKVIPCPVSEKKFFFDEKLRKAMREKLNISARSKVFLYSGSMVAYQALQHQFAQYEQLLKDPLNLIIIATSDPEVARVYFKPLESDRLVITSVTFEEMNSYYNLSDFAFLMRDNKQLNYVASPTKFGEYCLTGLPVIMNDTVDQATSISKKLGNYISHKSKTFEAFSDLQRQDISVASKQFYSRKELNEIYIDLFNCNLIKHLKIKTTRK